MLALAALTIAAGAAYGAPGDPLTPRQWVLSSATRIMALDNNLKGDIAVAAGEQPEGHIGESFEVNPVKGQACKFTLRHRDGPIIQSIDFEKLSDEVRVVPSGTGPYVTLQVAGLPGASCDIKNGVETSCKAGLSMLLFVRGSRPEPELAVRALRYIAANGCRPAVLPPG